MPGPNGDPAESAIMQAGMIEKAIAHFYSHEPPIPAGLHEDLATIFAAANAHAAYLLARAWIGKPGETS